MNSHRLSNKLKHIEEANGEAMFVFLSDIWLDQLKVFSGNYFFIFVLLLFNVFDMNATWQLFDLILEIWEE